MARSREVHLVGRPQGAPIPTDFASVDVETRDAGEGEVQVQTLLLSVDPYMRPRLDADQALGAAMLGSGIGRVVQSRHPDFREGDIVMHRAGMQERFVSDGRGLRKLSPDPDLPLSVYMHALGGAGGAAGGGRRE